MVEAAKNLQLWSLPLLRRQHEKNTLLRFFIKKRGVDKSSPEGYEQTADRKFHVIILSLGNSLLTPRANINRCSPVSYKHSRGHLQLSECAVFKVNIAPPRTQQCVSWSPGLHFQA